MFDRVALVNLDKRPDRLGAFKAKIIDVPVFADFVRYRAVEGDAVTVPQFFTSGGGAWGCRQSHLRILEDAIMDGVDTLLVLEDDVCFCPDFQERLTGFLRVVPQDWHGLMLGGQNQAEPGDTPVPGVKRATDTQRTHAYAVRGKSPMQALYRLWSRSDRHIDHLFGYWQQEHVVYQPDPFLCGQDTGKSDITGREDGTRYWVSTATPLDTMIYVVECSRAVIEQARLLGLHFGNNRDPLTGYDKGLKLIARGSWPPEQLRQWADLIRAEAAASEYVPAIWHSPLPTDLEERLGCSITPVRVETLEDVVQKIPALRPRYIASRIVWCWQGSGVEQMYGLEHYGWHGGYHRDPVTGLNNTLRRLVENTDLGTDQRKALLTTTYRQLFMEASKIRYGKVLLAHPGLDVHFVRDNMGSSDVRELTGSSVKELLQSYNNIMSEVLRSI